MPPLQPLLSFSLQDPDAQDTGRLRIGVLVADLPPWSRTGVGVSVASECESLVCAGVNVEVFTADRRAAVCGAGLNALPLPSDRFPTQAERWHVLHLHSLGLAHVAMEAARRLGIPLVYTAHSLIESELPLATEWISLQRSVFAAAQHVFFLNSAERDRACVRNASLWDRSSVRHHGICVSAAVPVAKERQRLVVVAGRFCLNKGTDVGVAALRIVMRDDSSVRALFAGGSGDRDCVALVAALASEFTGRVALPGWMRHDELAATLSSASLLLCPGRYEPFGLVALEALGCGVAVLSAATDGARETLAKDCGAQILKTHEPAAWSEAICNAMQGEALRKCAAAQGPAYVRRCFDPANKAATLKSVLLAVAHGAQASHATAQPTVCCESQGLHHVA